MKITVVSCMAYQDAWVAFGVLFKKFWPDCPYPLEWWTDERMPGASWCRVVAEHAAKSDEACLVLQEDFLLTAPVNQKLVDAGLLLMYRQNADVVRLYPCPGADGESVDKYFGKITANAEYAISCQAAIWRPEYLRRLASQLNTPAEFELQGTKLARTIPSRLFAFKRDVQPWPLQYLCSAIGRGKWSPDAVALCREHGIDLDLTVRPVA